VLGNVWVYSNFNNVDYVDENSSDYCHKTLYLYAFWVITASYILLGVFISCACCIGILSRTIEYSYCINTSLVLQRADEAHM